jgi:hypothetical protein
MTVSVMMRHARQKTLAAKPILVQSQNLQDGLSDKLHRH